MRKFATKVAGWLSIDSESGVTAIEYGLLAALIAVVIIVGVTLIGANLEAISKYISGKLMVPMPSSLHQRRWRRRRAPGRAAFAGGQKP